MDYLTDLHVVVAVDDGAGNAVFADYPGSFNRYTEGQAESRWVWETDSGAMLPTNVGAPPASFTFPGPGGTLFGIVCFPPHSAGKRRLDEFEGSGLKAGGFDDPAMHSTPSVDYEVVLSGRVDIELPSGEVRTLGPGSCMVMGGVPHAWKNRYDEPCIYAAIVIGLPDKT